ncbi:YceD family protein [Lutibacter sp.]
MKDLKEFDISFIGLKDGNTQFEYTIENKFFNFFDYDEFYNSNIKVNLSFVKKPTLFELNFTFLGWVEVACDVTNELFKYPIEISSELIVKFGEAFNNENEELLIIPYSDYKLNIAHYIYETVVLALPLKRIHPGVSDGTLQSEVLEKLKELEINKEEIEIHNKEIDPRWNKLKNILIDKNTSNGTS